MNLENKGGIIMELLFVLALLTKVLGGKKAKFNLKQFNKNVKKQYGFWREFFKEIAQLINIIFKFIFVDISTIYKKCICQETVKEEKLPDNVIRFGEYKLKKAK
jgi:hypothetical protein